MLTCTSSDSTVHLKKDSHLFPSCVAVSQVKHEPTSNVLSCTPLSYPYTDLQGRILQLWKCKEKLVASIQLPNGLLKVVSGKRIHNALQPTEVDAAFLARLEQIKLTTWQIGYLEECSELYVWPYLLAAAKGDPGIDIPAARRSLTTIRNHLAKDDPAKTHIGAAELEVQGQIVTVDKNTGKPQSHANELLEYRRSCCKMMLSTERGIKTYDKQLATPQKEPVEREKIQKMREELVSLHNDAKQLHDSLVSQKFPLILREEMMQALQKNQMITKPMVNEQKHLAQASFKEAVQQNQLVKSYNASHPGNPMTPKEGSCGSIGGVGQEVGIIKGLFDSLDSMEIERFAFYLTTQDGKQPFSDIELKHIMANLAIGIYVYDTIPFFSLHFNGDGDLYPIMHPVYQHTPVGRVISLLDYYMKGFLNGVIFDEPFLEEWQETKTRDAAILESRCINLREYCKQFLPEGSEYLSLKEIIQYLELQDELLSPEKDQEKAIFSEYSGFRSSFRIIAKQNSFKKTGSLFEIDAGFDVFYTIEPDPAYQAELEKYRCQYGKDPLGYKRLVKAYDAMKGQIEQLMPRLPLCRDLFEQLKIINFLCFLFKTMKKAHKIPALEPIKIETSEPQVGPPPAKKARKKGESSLHDEPATPISTTFPLFPYLPIRQLIQAKEAVEPKMWLMPQFWTTAQERADYEQLRAYIRDSFSEKDLPQQLLDHLLEKFEHVIQEKIPFELGKSKQDVARRKEHIAAVLCFANINAKNLVHELTTVKIPQIQKEIRQLSEILAKGREAESTLESAIEQAREKKWEVSSDPSRYELGAKRKINNFIKERQEELNKVMNDIRQITSGIEILEQNLNKALAASNDPLPFILEYFPLSYHEVSSTLVSPSKLSEEERAQNHRVIGGCGMKLKNKSCSPLDQSGAWPESVLHQLDEAPEEQFLALHPLGRDQGGYGFSLSILDEPVGLDQDYWWMEYILDTEDTNSFALKKQLFDAVSRGETQDFDKFAATVTRDHALLKDIHGVSLLHRAAEAKNPAFLKKLLEFRPDLTLADPDGFSPLHYAAQAGLVENCSLLLDSGASINAGAKNNATPLYIAVQHKQDATVKFLLNISADPNIAVTYGMTPLICAVHHRQETLVRTLLSCPSLKVDAEIEDGSTALFFAIDLELPDIVVLLRDKGADVNKQRKDSFSPLLLAYKKASLYICSSLLTDKCNLDCCLQSKRTPLHFAVERADPQYTELLLACGASIFVESWDQETPLLAAVRSRSADATQLILKHCERFYPDRLAAYVTHKNQQGDTALSLATKLGLASSMMTLYTYQRDLPHVALPTGRAFLEQLIAHRVNMYDLRALVYSLFKKGEISQEDIDHFYYVASQHGNFVAQNSLLIGEGRPPKEFVDERGWTPLHFYVQYGNSFEVDKFLYSQPKDILLTTKDGMTLAAIAAKSGQAKVLKMLCFEMEQREISLEGQYKGQHLFVAALESRDIDTVDAICFNTPTVNVPLDAEKRTPLHYAAIWGDVELFDLFRRREGDLYFLDAHGKTPIHYAFEYGWEDLIHYLLEPDREIELPKDVLCCISKGVSGGIIQKILPKVDINAKDPISKKTALSLAVEGDNLPLFQILCANGADYTIADEEGFTPFLRAAKLDRVSYVSQLFEKCLSHETKDGMNALHIASWLGSERTVTFLLDHGIDPLKKTPSGKTAREVALENGFTNIVVMLRDPREVLKTYKATLVALLKNGQTKEFLQKAQTLPLNASMVFEVDGKERYLPLLHLIHMLIPSADTLKEVRAAFLKLPGAKRDAASPEKATIDHLLAIGGEDIELAGLDVTQKDAEGNSVLHYYAHASSLISNILFEKALSVTEFVDVENNEGETPLFGAIKSKEEKKVELLLQKKADPNHLSKKRASPLLLAIGKEQDLIARLLVQHGANVNQYCLDTKMTPLHAAAEKENLPLVQFLVESGADVMQRMVGGILPIHLAAQKGNVNLFHFLRKVMVSRADPEDIDWTDDNGWTIAHHATFCQNLSLFLYFTRNIKLPLDQKAEQKRKAVRKIVPTGLTPLQLASLRGNSLIVRALLLLEADPNKLTDHDISALVFAGESSNAKTLRSFECLPIFQNQEQRTLATAAVVVRDAVPSLQVLHPSPETLTKPLDGYRTTIAHLAAEHDSVRILSYLHSFGISLNQKDFRGKSPFEKALEANKLLSARYLLLETEGADFEEKSSSGIPYLHFVCERGFVALADLLLRAGAPVNEKDGIGRTPLHLALHFKNRPLVQLLLEAGAEIDLPAMRDYLPKNDPALQQLVIEYAHRNAEKARERI